MRRVALSARLIFVAAPASAAVGGRARDRAGTAARLAQALVLGAAVSGCAAGANFAKRDDVPEWFRTSSAAASDEGFPKFADAPITPVTVRSPEEWALIESDLLSAASALAADPNSASSGEAAEALAAWQAREAAKATPAPLAE